MTPGISDSIFTIVCRRRSNDAPTSWAAGGEPVILHPPAADPLAEIPHRLEAFDGVLLPGGADLEPGRYGAQPAPETTDTVACPAATSEPLISAGIAL